MNLGEMAAALLRDLIQRDDVNAEALTNSIRYIHRQIQRDFNWRAQEARITGLPYGAGVTAGVVVETAVGKDDCKTIREVYIEAGGGVLTNVWPSNEGKASRSRRISQIAQNAQPTTAGGWNQSWYEAARRVVLLIPPVAPVTLTVDIYRYLPFYLTGGVVDPTLSDWFSENLPDAVQAGAAYWLCKNILEDNRAATFEQRFKESVAMALQSDMAAKQGALAQSYSPAQAAPRAA